MLHAQRRHHAGEDETKVLQTSFQEVPGGVQQQSTVHRSEVRSFVAGATTVPTGSSAIPIYRLVYETSYKDVVTTKNSKQLAYVCCPGWVQISPKSNGCNKGKNSLINLIDVAAALW